MGSISHATTIGGSGCGGGGDKPECVGKTSLTDWTYFNKSWTSDIPAKKNSMLFFPGFMTADLMSN
jgi:hypothetical protein